MKFGTRHKLAAGSDYPDLGGFGLPVRSFGDIA